MNFTEIRTNEYARWGHRVLATFLATTTLIYFYDERHWWHAPIAGCVSIPLEYIAYKILSSNYKNSAYKTFATIIVMCSMTLTWLGGRILENNAQKYAGDKAMEIRATMVREKSELARLNSELRKDALDMMRQEELEIHTRYDALQETIGLPKWRREFKYSEDWYRSPNRHANIRNWVNSRDSLERRRLAELSTNKARYKADEVSIPDGLDRFLTSGLDAATSQGTMKKRALRFVDLLGGLLILILSIGESNAKYTRKGITDNLLENITDSLKLAWIFSDSPPATSEIEVNPQDDDEDPEEEESPEYDSLGIYSIEGVEEEAIYSYRMNCVEFNGRVYSSMHRIRNAVGGYANKKSQKSKDLHQALIDISRVLSSDLRFSEFKIK